MISVHDLGGEGPDLLLAHATGLHGRVFEPLVRRLHHRFRAWAFDARGHGDSPLGPDADVGWDELADDVLTAADRLGLGQILGFGHSSGGTALLLAEARSPGTFRRVYCFEPVVLMAPRPADPEHNPLAAAARRRRQEFPTRAAAREHFAGRGMFSQFSPESLEAYIDHGLQDLAEGTVRLKCRADDEARMYSAPFPEDFLDQMAGVNCAVRVAHGAESTHFGPEVVQALARALPSGSTEVLPGLGHFGPLQDPTAVSEAVTAFLAPADS